MPETLKNTRAAYNKGAMDYHNGNGDCPYSFNKTQLSTWWYAGYNDAKLRCLDMNLIIDSNKNKLTQYS